MFPKLAMKLNMLIPWLALLLLLYGIGTISCSTVRNEINSDVLSLLDFKQAISNDPRQVLSNWNSSTQLCQWNGVKCNPKNRGRVTALNLAGLGLSGQIAPSIGNLTFLHTLNLSDNLLSGHLPRLGTLQRMQVLDLTDNSLDGTIPDTLTNCSNLRQISFYNNFLEGEIPVRLDHLPNLFDLVLAYNDFTGTIPPTLSNITHATRIALGYNHLTGSIPYGLWKLPSLSALLVGGNKLSGEIPRDLFNLSSLQRLGLEFNELGKAIPPNIGDAFPDIQILSLGANQFEGAIPASLGNASQLLRIDLSNNSLSGGIPSSFSKLSNLNFLNLQGNKFDASESQSSDFLFALKNCTLLKMLSLSRNQFSGAIPDSVGNLSSLSFLYLGGNMMSGAVPLSIGNLQALTLLSLERNNLSGTIEEWVGKLTQLQNLDLELNNFTGLVPSSIGNLTQVTQLSLGGNSFEGTIPPTLGNLQRPSVLDLSNNKLQGNIPLEITNLVELITLDLSSNQLTGEIPDSWYGFQSIQTIQMAQNLFIGNIPKSFGNLVSLKSLNLSHNNLSGAIPTVLEALQFSKIDLSYNCLEGMIPNSGIFENTTAVSLDGNLELCGGAAGFQMHSCPNVSKRTKRSYYLVRVLIPIFGFMSLVLLVYFIILEKKMSGKTYSSFNNYGEHFPKVSYNDLAQATRNFSESNLIGRGSCGSVYRGRLKESKMEVAVKVFNLEMRGAERSFISECEALRSIQHRNLLSIVTACSTVDNTGGVFKALVYEFMPKGNLDTCLHHKGQEKSPEFLGLDQRISIAVNIADVLDYIHHDCGRPTVHCDLKPSNILLDDEMTARLGDFGISRFYADSWMAPRGSTSSVGVKGTIGYIPPEYGRGGHVSTSGDVYSFGILLLEMLTGKRPTDPIFEDGLEIINFVAANFPHQIFLVIDANLLEECKDVTQQAREPTENLVHQCVESLFELALSCTRRLPSERPNMKQIASTMHSIKASYVASKSKK